MPATLRIEYKHISDDATFKHVKRALEKLSSVEVNEIDRETAWLTYDLDDVDLDAIERLITEAGAVVTSIHREL